MSLYNDMYYVYKFQQVYVYHRIELFLVYVIYIYVVYVIMYIFTGILYGVNAILIIVNPPPLIF